MARKHFGKGKCIGGGDGSEFGVEDRLGNRVGNGVGNGVGSLLGDKFYLKQKERRVSVARTNLGHAFLAFAFPIEPLMTPGFIAGEVLGNIMAGNMMSRLFLELREKRGLIYNVKFDIDMYNDGGIFMINMSTGNNKENIEAVIKVVLNEMKKIKRNGVGSSELKTFKDFMIGNWTMDLNDPGKMAEFFGIPEVLCGKFMSKKKYISLIRNVSVSDIKSAARRIFRLKALNLCVLAK